MSIEVEESINTGDIIESIKQQSPLIVGVSLIDNFEDSRTFHIVYQSRKQNLTKEEISQIRKKIIESIKTKFASTVK